MPAPATDPLILVVDDDIGVCRALSRLLSASGFRVRTYERARELLDEVDSIEAACVIADIRMPEIDGIALVRMIREMGIEVPVIFMTATSDVVTVVSAMKEGAVDLLPKPFGPDSLLDAIARAIDVARRSDDSHRSLVALWRLAAKLTPREAEVCALVACGSPNKNVAARIGTTEKTVKVHRGRVMQKLAAPSFAEVIRIVDRLRAEPDRINVRLDGMDIDRPSSVDVIVRVMAVARGELVPSDQRSAVLVS